MIHYVVEEVDSGECIVYREVEMRMAESCEELEARIHEKEWEIIVEGTRSAIGRLKAGVGGV